MSRKQQPTNVGDVMNTLIVSVFKPFTGDTVVKLAWAMVALYGFVTPWLPESERAYPDFVGWLTAFGGLVKNVGWGVAGWGCAATVSIAYYLRRRVYRGRIEDLERQLRRFRQRSDPARMSATKPTSPGEYAKESDAAVRARALDAGLLDEEEELHETLDEDDTKDLASEGRDAE